MTVVDAIGLVVAVGLLFYLAFALFHPEDMS